METSTVNILNAVSQQVTAKTPDEIAKAATEFEAVFIKQMLEHAGLADAFGAEEGLATDALSSFVLDKIAMQMAERGDFGLADQFAENLERLNKSDEGRGVRL